MPGTLNWSSPPSDAARLRLSWRIDLERHQMGTCFVIQPFDSGEYDRRFDEIYSVAILEAGLEPYRVDRDASVTIPIAKIESGIRGATICFAEISEDNPNVWFELGFAIVEKKEIIIVCNESKRKLFPFDIQHRTVIKYTTGSPSDFLSLKKTITDRLNHAKARVERLSIVHNASPIKDNEGLSDHEIAFLAVMAADIDVSGGVITHWSIKNNMEKIGTYGNCDNYCR